MNEHDKTLMRENALKSPFNGGGAMIYWKSFLLTAIVGLLSTGVELQMLSVFLNCLLASFIFYKWEIIHSKFVDVFTRISLSIACALIFNTEPFYSAIIEIFTVK